MMKLKIAERNDIPYVKVGRGELPEFGAGLWEGTYELTFEHPDTLMFTSEHCIGSVFQVDIRDLPHVLLEELQRNEPWLRK